MSQICDQQFTINDAARTRELFFYSVEYNANGGVYTGDAIEYHHDSDKVMVSSVVPTRDGYDFLGWMDESGNLYQPGDVLTEGIYSQYKLTAKWEESKYAMVNLTVVADHTGDGGQNPNPGGEMEIDLDYRRNNQEPYVEVVGKTLIYNDWYEKGVTQNGVTTVTYPAIFKELSDDFEYSANVFLDHYYVSDSSVTTSTDAEGNPVYDVTVYLKYDPKLFNLSYSVVADASVPKELIPLAVDMKVLSWDANVENQWAPISRHEKYSADITLDSADGRHGEGSYGVPVYRENNEKYYYRVAAVGFTLADGTELTASGTDGVNFYSDSAPGLGDGAYYAVITVDGGADIADTNLDGAYGIYATGNTEDGYVQQGTITVTIYLNRYDVIFNSMGGSAVETITDQFTIPDISAYVPTKAGYTFNGWYTDASCTAGNEAKAGSVLTQNVTLYAKWIENRAVQGTVTVAGFYMLDGEKYSIHDIGRVESIKVLLQKIDHNGYAFTVENKDIPLTYGGDYGTGTFEFKDIPNDGKEYRIDIISADYEEVFQNELSNSTVVTDYAAYDSLSYKAEFNGDNTAVVNTYLHFEPVSFDMEYSIDATAIGEGFRPTSAEILVLYDDGNSGIYPQSWPVITQMIKQAGYEGQKTALQNGTGIDTYPVWNTKPDGKSLYDYSIRIKDYVIDGEELEYSSSSPFGIQYSGFARYDEESGQTQKITATFVPKMYTVTYDLGVPAEVEVKNMESYLSMSGTYVDSYYWSYGKTIMAEPEREGYNFLGWYDENGNIVTEIAADLFGNITLYAKWQSNITFDVMVDAGYYSKTRESADKVGVIALNAYITNYEEVKDNIITFGIYVLNDPTSESKITVESTSTVKLEEDKGYFHTVISNIPKEKFSTKVFGIPYATVDADGDSSTSDIAIIPGALFSTSVSDINKWLGADNKYAN